MRIEQDEQGREWFAEGDNFQKAPAEKNRESFSPGNLDTIVIHYTAGRNAQQSVDWLRREEVQASAHLVVGRDLSVTQLVPFNFKAWHAGRSAWQGRSGFNKYSIGIEIDNAGQLQKSGEVYIAWFEDEYSQNQVVEGIHRNETLLSHWHRYTKDQIDLVEEICAVLVEKYKISSILGHEEISPKRKKDPGPAFPLDRLRDSILSPRRDEEGEEEEEVSTAFSGAGIVTASKLNIRTAPRRSAATAAPPLLKGAVVDIVQESDGWYEVEMQTRGWVAKEFVKRG